MQDVCVPLSRSVNAFEDRLEAPGLWLSHLLSGFDRTPYELSVLQNETLFDRHVE